MSFLYPVFLWALALIAIPIIIHLFQFRRYKTVYFTNVKFLREVKDKTTSRNQLKHLLVLLSRILAVSFLVFAFSQPFLPQSKDKPVEAGKSAVSIYIDNSFSMAAETDEESLLNSAKRKASEIIKAYGKDDRFQLITNDLESRNQRLISREEALAYLDDLTLSSYTRTLRDIQAIQNKTLNSNGIESKVIYWLSDYQKNIVDFNNDTTASYYMVPLESQQVNNLYIDSAWLSKPITYLNQPNELLVRIRNIGDNLIESRRISLSVNQQVKAIGNVTIAPNSFSVDTLNFTLRDTGWNLLKLSITDYPITFDDNYYLSLNVKDKIDVLIINEDESNPYLKAIYTNADKFVLEEQQLNRLNYNSLKQFALIVLNNLESIPSGLSFELEDYISKGGVVALFPNAKIDMASYNAFADKYGLNRMTGIKDSEEEVRVLHSDNPIFDDVFDEVPKNVSLPKTNLHYRFNKRNKSSEQELLGFRGGGSFISAFDYKLGKLFVCASPLDINYTDFPVHAIFVPTLFKIALSGANGNKPSFTFGKDAVVEVLSGTTTSNDGVFLIKGNEIEFIPEQRRVGAKLQIVLDKQFEKEGFYSLTEGDNRIIEQIALNYNRNESILEYFSPDELTAQFESDNFKILDVLKADLGKKIKELDKGVILWKLCLIFALMFLAVEVLLLRLMP